MASSDAVKFASVQERQSSGSLQPSGNGIFGKGVCAPSLSANVSTLMSCAYGYAGVLDAGMQGFSA